MKELDSRHLIWLGIALLALIVLAAPLFFAPWQQQDYRPVQPDPLDLAALQRVEINTADEAALCTLPGIGPQKAKAIIEYRSVYGPFSRLPEVARVKGISEKIIQSWKDLAWIDPDTGETQ